MTVRVVRVTVRVLTVFAAGAGEASLVVPVVLASGAAGVTSVRGGGAEVGTAGVVWVVGSVVAGGAVCAGKTVAESARAAAIAGRALVRAKCVVLIIIGDNRAPRPSTHDYRSADR